MAVFSPCLHGVFLLYVSFFLILSFYRDASHIAVELTPMISFNLNYLFKDLYPQMQSHVKILGDRTSSTNFGETQFSLEQDKQRETQNEGKRAAAGNSPPPPRPCAGPTAGLAMKGRSQGFQPALLCR